MKTTQQGESGAPAGAQNLNPDMQYSTRADCPGLFFRCEPQRATVTVSSCSKMWAEANAKGRKKDPCDRLHHCQGCEVGATHSGQVIVRSGPLYGARMCNRCNRPASRLIGGDLCPSCYNRQREILIGKNGKGTRPVKHPPLEPRRLLVAVGGQVQEQVFPRTIDALEAFVCVLRHAQGVVMFGFSGQVVRTRPVQMEFPF